MADFAPTGLLLGAIAGLIVISGVSRSSLPVRCSAALVVGGCGVSRSSLPARGSAALVVGGCGVSRSSLPVRCSAALVVGGLSAFSIVNGSLVALQASTSPWIANGVARCLDLPAYWIEHAVGTTQGALEMKLQFPPGKAGRREPLLSTGLPGQGDIVYIEYL